LLPTFILLPDRWLLAVVLVDLIRVA